MDATHPQHNPIADMDGSDVARIIKFRATQVDNASTSMALSIALDYAQSFAIDSIHAQSTN
ncbi:MULTISPECIES: hypothetical protein [Nitrosomonas]|uniref:hypothetical protein n=1 Tax=Nitrosomonas TaxID=914 RepID=UPI00130D764D|nr:MULTISPECIES: hypothetical protein [Nitrosomonas]UVS61708.1 hypothetical protein NX761_00705 [Nitrosomonas sp. PLL12]